MIPASEFVAKFGTNFSKVFNTPREHDVRADSECKHIVANIYEKERTRSTFLSVSKQ